MNPRLLTAFCLLLPLCLRADVDPATEPSVVAVGKVWPAVVNINTERIVQSSYQNPYDQFFNQFFGGPMRPPRQLRQRVRSLGSGFLVDAAGYIVTNEHVVERAADLKIQVTTSDGKTYPARYVSGDPTADLALIKIDAGKPLPFISLKDTSPNMLGQTVLVLGNPLGYGLAVSRGILSALNRTVTLDEMEYRHLVQTDAAINPGNSGGPLIDLSGKLIGVSSVKMAYTPQGVPTQGLGFGIPADVVREKVRQFMQGGPAAKVAAQSAAARFYGLKIQDLTPVLTELLGYVANGRGVLIADVEDGSPAETAGLKRGLVIYKVGDHDVANSRQMEELLAEVTPGTVADFEIGVVKRSGDRFFQEVRTVSLTAR